MLYGSVGSSVPAAFQWEPTSESLCFPSVYFSQPQNCAHINLLPLETLLTFSFTFQTDSHFKNFHFFVAFILWPLCSWVCCKALKAESTCKERNYIRWEKSCLQRWKSVHRVMEQVCRQSDHVYGEEYQVCRQRETRYIERENRCLDRLGDAFKESRKRTANVG